MNVSVHERLTEQQLELLKSFKYLCNEKSINDVRELLSLYYEHKLDSAIEKAETVHNYSKEIYESWLARQKNKNS